MARLHTEGGIIVNNSQISKEFEEILNNPKEFVIGINDYLTYEECKDIPKECIDHVNRIIAQSRIDAGDDSILILYAIKTHTIRASYIPIPSNNVFGGNNIPIYFNQEIRVFFYKDIESLMDAAKFKKEYKQLWQENSN